MSQITRTWLGFAALGAGLIHLALVLGSPVPVAVALIALGATEFTWGIVTFASDRLVAAKTALVVAVIPIIAWSLLVVVSTLLAAPDITASLTLLPMLAAMLFELFVATVLARHLRRQSSTDAPLASPTTPSAGRYLLALTAGALLVGAITTPALAATEAGRYAQPHGEHGTAVVPSTPSDDNETSDTADQLADLVQRQHEH